MALRPIRSSYSCPTRMTWRRCGGTDLPQGPAVGRQFVFTRLDSDDAIDGVISGTLGDPGMARCGAKAGLSWMHKQDGLPRIRIDVVAAEREEGRIPDTIACMDRRHEVHRRECLRHVGRVSLVRAGPVTWRTSAAVSSVRCCLPSGLARGRAPGFLDADGREIDNKGTCWKPPLRRVPGPPGMDHRIGPVSGVVPEQIVEFQNLRARCRYRPCNGIYIRTAWATASRRCLIVARPASL